MKKNFFKNYKPNLWISLSSPDYYTAKRYWVICFGCCSGFNTHIHYTPNNRIMMKIESFLDKFYNFVDISY